MCVQAKKLLPENFEIVLTMNRIKEILATDPFSNEENRLMELLIKRKFDDEFRVELETELKEKYHIDKNQRSPKKLIRMIIIAGTIAASMILGWFIINPVSSNITIEERAMAMVEMDHKYHPGITKGISANQLRSEAVKSYNEGQYSSATNQFLQLSSLTDEDMFYLGVALLKDNKPQQATEYFRTLMQHETFGSEARWYLSLSYILTGSTEDAIKTMNDIKEGDYQYGNAQELRSLIQ